MTRKAPPDVFAPAAYEAADIRAIQALSAGEATPEQQQRAFKWIVEEASAYLEFAYRPGQEGERDTTFALGRQFTGQQIVKMTRLNAAALVRRKTGVPQEQG